MLNQKVQNVELNIVDPSHVSLKQRVEEKKGSGGTLKLWCFAFISPCCHTVKATFLSHQLVTECHIGNEWYHLMQAEKKRNLIVPDKTIYHVAVCF